MATYCFKCPCGYTFTATERTPTNHCEAGDVIRDYRAERVGVGPAVGNIRRDFKAEQDRDLFLPSRRTFEKQHAHKGEKAVDAAIKEWNETHEPHVKGGGKYRPK